MVALAGQVSALGGSSTLTVALADKGPCLLIDPGWREFRTKNLTQTQLQWGVGGTGPIRDSFGAKATHRAPQQSFALSRMRATNSPRTRNPRSLETGGHSSRLAAGAEFQKGHLKA